MKALKYKNEKEIVAVVESFETATIRRADWRHAEHLTVACYYVFHHDYETAVGKMRGGIFNLLKSFGVDLEKEMPYHETLTRFWMRATAEFVDSKNGCSIVQITNELLAKFADKDLPLQFYTRELLSSERARREYVAPDLENF